MDLNQIIKQQLKAEFAKKGARSAAEIYREIAIKYNVHPERVRKHNRILNGYRDKELKAASEAYNSPKNDFIRKIDNTRGTLESSVESNFDPKSDEELYELHKIDAKKYVISSYWSKMNNSGKFTSSVSARLISANSPEFYQNEFKEFLENYTPPIFSVKQVKATTEVLPNACLIINKQDEHINKLDIGGDNNIIARGNNMISKIYNILRQSKASNNLQTIKYIIGSDEFNSEWTGLTTKGTPQQNIGSYHDTFEIICNYEVHTISHLLAYAENVEVIYIPGNHDEFVGWHLINWLKSYFRNTTKITFDDSPAYRKYTTYSNTALMFNHGDALKPEKLASLFPMEFKEGWSNCDNYYIFTGDRHHLLAKNIHGIEFYQIPSLSKAKSTWDDKNGYTATKAELTAFLIEEDKGLTNIYKQQI